MTDIVTISRECAEAFYRHAVGSGKPDWMYIEQLNKALSAPPPPSGLREALEEIAGTVRQYAEAYDANPARLEAYAAYSLVLKIASAALASPDDGWVKVDAEHPLPSDLKENDEVKHVTYYRRRPSAEQGGGEADNALRS
jgi:hypothetical protein